MIWVKFNLEKLTFWTKASLSSSLVHISPHTMDSSCKMENYWDFKVKYHLKENNVFQDYLEKEGSFNLSCKAYKSCTRKYERDITSHLVTSHLRGKMELLLFGQQVNPGRLTMLTISRLFPKSSSLINALCILYIPSYSKHHTSSQTCKAMKTNLCVNTSWFKV